MRPLLTALLSVTLLAPGAQAQDSAWVGRWVNVEPDFALLVLNIERGGGVQVLMPAPKFSAIYARDAGRVVIRFPDGKSESSFVINSDTTAQWGDGPLIRVSRAADGDALAGSTWTPPRAGEMNGFVTFRRDGAVSLEVGFPVEAAFNGDTLRLRSVHWPARSLVLRRDGDSLYVAESGKPERRFVLRPWGCFGLEGESERAGC